MTVVMTVVTVKMAEMVVMSVLGCVLVAVATAMLAVRWRQWMGGIWMGGWLWGAAVWLVGHQAFPPSFP